MSVSDSGQITGGGHKNYPFVSILAFPSFCGFSLLPIASSPQFMLVLDGVIRRCAAIVVGILSHLSRRRERETEHFSFPCF